MQSVIIDRKNHLFSVLAMSRDSFLIRQVLAYTIGIQKNNDEFVLPCSVSDIIDFAAIAFDPVNAAYRPELILVLLSVFHKDFVTIIEREYLDRINKLSADELLAVIAYVTANSPILLQLTDIVSIIVRTPTRIILDKELNYVQLLIDELRKKDYTLSQILEFAQPGTDTYKLLMTYMVLHCTKESKAIFKDKIANVLVYADDAGFNGILSNISKWGVSKEQLSQLTIGDRLSERKLLAMEQCDLFKNLAPIQERIAKAEEQKRVEAEKKWQELEGKRIEEANARAEKERLEQERLEAERKQQEAAAKRVAEEKVNADAEAKRIEEEKAKTEKERLERERREAEQKQQEAEAKHSAQKQIKQTVPRQQKVPSTSYSSVAATQSQQAVPRQQNVKIVDDRERLLAERQAGLDKRQAKLEEQEKALWQRETAVLNREQAAADAQEKKDKEQQEQLVAKDQVITELKQQVATIPDYVARSAELEAELIKLQALQQESIRLIADLRADKVARDRIIARYESVVHPSAMSSNGVVPQHALFPSVTNRTFSSTSSAAPPKSPASS